MLTLKTALIEFLNRHNHEHTIDIDENYTTIIIPGPTEDCKSIAIKFNNGDLCQVLTRTYRDDWQGFDDETTLFYTAMTIKCLHRYDNLRAIEVRRCELLLRSLDCLWLLSKLPVNQSKL